ncbi:MAG: hypothetical protein HDR77_02425 [Bacteroides sp.]|nr:hypothetical protein [Bacteroides sp.]
MAKKISLFACLLSLLIACSSNKDKDKFWWLPQLIYADMADAEAPLNKSEYIPDSTKEDLIYVDTGEILHFYTTTIYGKKFQLILNEKDKIITGLCLKSKDFSDVTELDKITSKVKNAIAEEWEEPLQDSWSPKDKGETMRVILWDILNAPLLIASDSKTLLFSLQYNNVPSPFDE